MAFYPVREETLLGGIDWHPHPDVLIGILLIQGGYLLGVGPIRRRFGLSPSVSPSSVIWFTLGVLVLFAALSWPLHELSEQLFSVHMTQHILLTLVVPPLLLMGIPEWLIRPLFRARYVLAAGRFLTFAPMAFFIFSVTFLLWHSPNFYEAALRHLGIHIFEHSMFLGAAVLMWWPILSPLRELPRLAYPLQLLYLFLLSIGPGFVGAMITFSTELVYPWYGEAAESLGISALMDQQLGGLIMKVPGFLIVLLAFIIIFFVWFNQENSIDERQDNRSGKVPGFSGNGVGTGSSG